MAVPGSNPSGSIVFNGAPVGKRKIPNIRSSIFEKLTLISKESMKLTFDDPTTAETKLNLVLNASLGHTVAELDITGIKVCPKTRFSMLIPDVENQLKEKTDRKTILLCGIETQACIQQTVLDLLEKDYQVHVIVDACSSRTMVDRMYAFDRMKEAGAFLTTSESALLGLCKDAAHPKFKEIQRLIAQPAPDSGLLMHK